MLKTRPKPQYQSLYEHVMAAPTGRVDRVNGFIRGVKILGRSSRNGREYSNAAIQEAAKLYEGIGVNLNHPSRATPNASRPVEDGIGWLENVKVLADGVYGDLAVIKSHPRAETVFEFAERNPTRFGLSHNAGGNVVTRNGRQIVESVGTVRSVDLVQNPATNASLFESFDPSPRRQPGRTNLRQFQESAKSLISDRDLRASTRVKALRSWLQEEMDGPPGASSGDEPDPCAAMKAAIRAELIKPDVSDEAKILAVLELIGGGPEPAKGADAMVEAYGESLRQSTREGGSRLLESVCGRTIAGTQHAADRAARVAEMLKRYR